MEAGPSRRTVHVAVGVMYVFFLVAGLAQAGFLFAFGLVAFLVVLWLKGFLRFRRVRAWSRNTAKGLASLVHRRKPNRAQGITLIAVFSTLALLILLNQLRIAAPGEGRGLSVPLEMPSLQFNFGGISSAGEWIATIISYGALFGFTFLAWLRLWRGVAHEDAPWRVKAYWGALAAFVLMPLIFALLMATVAPEVKPDDEASQKANVAFSDLWIRVTMFVIATSFAAAALLPHVGPGPTPRAPVPPVAVEVTVAPAAAAPTPTYRAAATRRK